MESLIFSQRPKEYAKLVEILNLRVALAQEVFDFILKLYKLRSVHFSSISMQVFFKVSDLRFYKIKLVQNIVNVPLQRLILKFEHACFSSVM